MNIDQGLQEFHNEFPKSPAANAQLSFGGSVGNIMDLTLQPNPSFPNILYWVTSKGSLYVPLPSGQTIRYKDVEKMWQEPQDLCVFLPPEEWIKQNAPQGVANEVTNDNNQSIFYELLREYLMPLRTNTKVYIQDEKGNRINTNAEAQKATYLFITLVRDNKPIVSIPVEKQPKVGYSPYDSRRKEMGDGTYFHERHIGNSIKHIMARRK